MRRAHKLTQLFCYALIGVVLVVLGSYTCRPRRWGARGRMA